jgi:hypothetical protein
MPNGAGRMSGAGPNFRVLLDHALDEFDFEAAEELLDEAGFSANGASRELCRVGMEVMQLDAEEFAGRARNCKALPQGVRAELFACAWPTTPDQLKNGSPANAVLDIRPTFSLLLELLAFNYDRRNWTDVLALLHLMAQYMSLLAWQPVLGDAGRPDLLGVRFANPNTGARTNTPCELSRPQVDLVNSLPTGYDVRSLRVYLVEKHSRMADVLLKCGGSPANSPIGSAGGCKNQCCVVAGPDGTLSRKERDDLAIRVSLARYFTDSKLVKLRHTSPVGHFFAVPGKEEIAGDWTQARKTMRELLRQSGAAHCDVDLLERGLVPGIAGLLGICAGGTSPLSPTRILPDLRDAAKAAVARTR